MSVSSPMLRNYLCDVKSHTIPTHTQVLAALRFLSVEVSSVSGESVGLTQSSASMVIDDVVNVMTKTGKGKYIRMPCTAVYMSITKTKQDFSKINNLFPRGVGATDSIHIPIKAPDRDEHRTASKQFHSLNFQIVCGSRNLITGY